MSQMDDLLTVVKDGFNKMELRFDGVHEDLHVLHGAVRLLRTEVDGIQEALSNQMCSFRRSAFQATIDSA